MLNNKDKKYLRSLGMNIEPIVQVGKNGVNESVLFSLNEALTARELVKIKVLKNCFEEMDEVAESIAAGGDCEIVQTIGRNILAYRPNKKTPVIKFPE